MFNPSTSHEVDGLKQHEKIQHVEYFICQRCKKIEGVETEKMPHELRSRPPEVWTQTSTLSSGDRHTKEKKCKKRRTSKYERLYQDV
ncbi:MAG: hypothetical protein ACP5G0_06245 [Desulfomonilia bacterium]